MVGTFPGDAAVIRLVGALLEVHDEWQVADRAYFSEHSMAQLHKISDDGQTKEVTADSHTALPAA